MYTTVITSLFFVSTLLTFFIFCIGTSICDDEGLKKSLNFRRIIKSSIFIEFTLFNFLFSFMKPEFVFQVVLQVLSNLIAVLYFFIDFFYYSQRRRTYLLWLQNIVFKNTKIQSVFEIESANGAVYKGEKSRSSQKYEIVNIGKGTGECIYIPYKNEGILLIPKKEMDHNTLMFYAQKLELDIIKKPIFGYYNGKLSPESFKEYDYASNLSFYFWIRDKLLSSKGKFILGMVGFGVLFTLVIVFVLIYSFTDFDIINDWLFKKI